MADIIKQKISVAWDTRKGINAIVHVNGEKTLVPIKNVDWYFYILSSDIQKANPIFLAYRAIIRKIINAGKYTQVFVDMPYQKDVNIIALREALELNNIEVFEYDLNKTKRYMVDNDIQIETDLNILYFDIETDDSKGGISIGRDRIVSWAGCDNKDNVLYESGDEKEILTKFLESIKKYDIITGWNSGEFDLPYIQARCLIYNLEFEWKSMIHIDMMQRCFKIYGYEASIIGLKNFSLNEIARYFLNEQKADTHGRKISDLVENSPDLLKEYNIQDTILLKKLDNKLGIIKLMVQECAWTGSFLFKFYIGELLDNYIIREAKKRNLVLKSRPSERTRATLEDINITGGYVAEPITGLYSHVNICDFKSLYPSIIVGWNIGSDSLNEELSIQGFNALTVWLKGKKIEQISFDDWHAFLQSEKTRLDPTNAHIQASNNVFFRRYTNSFIGDLMESLLNQRSAYKKKLKVLEFDTQEYNNTYASERVVKEMANSMFGITCDKNSRYFNQFVSEAITYTGQYLNKLSSHIAKTIGLTSIYGDTDSIFIVGSDDLSRQIVEINRMIQTFLDTRISLRKNIVSLEYEKHFSKLLLLEKKRYTGLLSMKDGKPLNKIFSRGTEDVKKSNTQLGKKVFKEFVLKLFDESFSKANAIQYVKDKRQELETGLIDPLELIITTKVSKPIEKYKVMSTHSRLAKRLIDSGDMLPIVESEKKMGARLEYIMVDNHGVNDGVLIDEYASNFNREYYWNVQVYAPIKRLLECVYPTEDWNEYLNFTNNQKLF
jgi:DNA polymerase elongation subunit (family B)